ncbi:hypothetical protein J651_0946 [Acinetobacter baumannii 1293320]|nr:hypothetical protein J651_0946 [Acinetobacter baumannii 1293320]
MNFNNNIYLFRIFNKILGKMSAMTNKNIFIIEPVFNDSKV